MKADECIKSGKQQIKGKIKILTNNFSDKGERFTKNKDTHLHITKYTLFPSKDWTLLKSSLNGNISFNFIFSNNVGQFYNVDELYNCISMFMLSNESIRKVGYCDCSIDFNSYFASSRMFFVWLNFKDRDSESNKAEKEFLRDSNSYFMRLNLLFVFKVSYNHFYSCWFKV